MRVGKVRRRLIDWPQDLAQHVGVVLHKDLSVKEIAERLRQALVDYDQGVYDEHIRRAYCAARTHYNYRDVITRYIEPAFQDSDRLLVA